MYTYISSLVSLPSTTPIPSEYTRNLEKKGTDESICRAGVDTDEENGYVNTVGEGKHGTNWGTHIYTITGQIDS